MRTVELTKQELAAVYRMLNPTQIYSGDVPELWMRDILLRSIRLSIRRQHPYIPDRASIRI